MIDLRALPIDAAELQARIDQLGGIGTHPEGGLYRALYDDGWVEAMALVRSWLDELGMATRFDAVGNLWGRLDGSEGGDAVVTGSHVDTVRTGGKYDGAYPRPARLPLRVGAAPARAGRRVRARRAGPRGARAGRAAAPARHPRRMNRKMDRMSVERMA